VSDTTGDNIVYLTEPPTTPEVALTDAIGRGLSDVFILGYTPQGTLYIRSSADVTRKEALWLLENAKLAVMGVPIDYGDEDDE